MAISALSLVVACADIGEAAALLSRTEKPMVVFENVRKCVVFIGIKLASGEMRPVGSAFFIGNDQASAAEQNVHLVTARHVIDGIKGKLLEEVWVRYNSLDGQAHWWISPIDSWKFHPSDSNIDVAVLRMAVPFGWDHMLLSQSMCVSPAMMLKHEVGLGDEVFVVGLFHHHHGTLKNIPIVRVGNLAALDEEKVQTKVGLVDAYLIEARSIGGLSGSPVFLNLGFTRVIGGELKIAQPNKPVTLLLGLMHGHFDVKSSSLDDVTEDSSGESIYEKVNTGIGIVVPISKALEVIAGNPAPQPLQWKAAKDIPVKFDLKTAIKPG